MGLGNKLIVSATGFPGTNKTLRFIQDAFREPLGALAQLAGDKTIVTGVVVDTTDPANTIVSNGFITYAGEIIPFVGGSFANTVTIIEAFENANYNTDADNNQQLDSLPAYRTIYAKCGTGGIDIFNFSELAPLKTIKELSNLELPSNVLTYLHKGSFVVETGYGTQIQTISFPDVGTNNYMIIQSAKTQSGLSVYPGEFTPDNYTQTSFTAKIPDYVDALPGNFVIFNFMLIKLD